MGGELACVVVRLWMWAHQAVCFLTTSSQRADSFLTLYRNIIRPAGWGAVGGDGHILTLFLQWSKNSELCCVFDIVNTEPNWCNKYREGCSRWVYWASLDEAKLIRYICLRCTSLQQEALCSSLSITKSEKQ